MATPSIRYLVITALCALATAADSSDGERQLVPIPAHEREQIILSLVERYPEIASSPGIKAAYAPLDRSKGSLTSVVIFHPHREVRGIKEAFQTFCRWDRQHEEWRCENIQIRRYLKLETQEFEVRVRGDISSEAAFALIAASRQQLLASLGAIPDDVSTATIILPRTDGGYRITWGTPEGRGRLGMHATLRAGADPTDPENWYTTILETARESDAESLVGGYGQDPRLFSITHYFDNGEFYGYVLNPGVEEERFKSLGLERGDKLVRVNGTDVVVNAAVVARMFDVLDTGESVLIAVERGDQPAIEIPLNLVP